MKKVFRNIRSIKGLSDIPLISDLKIERPSLERFGIWYFKRMRRRTQVVRREVKLHILTEEERKGLERIQHGAIFRSALAGAISAAVSAIASIHWWPLIDDTTHVVTNDQLLEYWLWVGGITIGITTVEIAFLYFDALRATYRLSLVAGVPLFPKDKEASEMAGSLARAALELPNPISNDLDINPNRDSPRWKVIIAPVVYKLKILATNFIAKMLLRRMMGRAVARVYIEFIAVPISALWNAWVTWKVMEQARIRALGPSFALEFVEDIMINYPDLSLEAKREMLRAVGTSVVRSENFHPNLEYLVYILMNRLPFDDLDELDNAELFITNFKGLSQSDKEAVLQLFIVASILDGRLKRKETGLLQETYALTGVPFEMEPITRLRKEFYAGHPVKLPIIDFSDAGKASE